MGSQLEASSGCYTLMALLPLSDTGVRLVEHEQQRVRRDSRWQSQLPTGLISDALHSDDSELNDNDWLELAGFAFAHRPPESSRAALQRLLLNCDIPLPLLRGELQANKSRAELGQLYKLSGRKALLAAQRQQVQAALYQLDVQRCESLKRWIQQVQQGE